MTAPPEVASIVSSVADDLPVGVWVARAPSGEFVYANGAFAEIMGMGARDDVAVGAYADPYGIYTRDGRLYPEQLLPFVRALREGGTVVVDDIVIHRRDGRKVNIRAHARPVAGADGAPTHVVIAFFDITREVEAERVRDEFLSVASHELHTPIATLQLALQALGGNLPAGGATAESLAVCQRQVQRLATLVQQLLDVSRLRGGRLEFVPEEMDLAALAREMAARFTAALARSGSSLTLQADAPAVGRWDPLRLEQVVANLLGNAVKYGQGRPIALAVRAEAAGARLIVTDQGIGIDAADHARIFRRFERAVSERQFGGLGIGLWITAEIVARMGGRVVVDSAPGAGATFTVELPWNR